MSVSAYLHKPISINFNPRITIPIRQHDVVACGADVQAVLVAVVAAEVAGKAIGIATATVNTFQGASEALKQKSSLPSPFDVVAKVANVATVLATGLKTVKSIASVKVPGGGGGGGTGAVPSGGGSVAAPAPPSFNVVGATETSVLADTVAEQTQEPVQAYVVSNDVTTAQSLENNIVEGATL